MNQKIMFAAVIALLLLAVPVIAKNPTGNYSAGHSEGVTEEKGLCYDSDGGKDFYEKGTTTYLGQIETDYCVNDKTVKDYVCQETESGKTVIAWYSGQCRYGCFDGACAYNASKLEESEPVKKRVPFVPEIPEEEEDEDEDQEFGTTNVTLKLVKGWNLVSLPGPLERFVEDTCSADNHMIGYIFMKEYQRYFDIRGAHKVLGDDEALGQYMAENSFWIFGQEDCTITAEVGPSVHSEGIELYEDWNFMSYTKDMIGKTVGEVLDHCDVRRVIDWNEHEQDWSFADHDRVITTADTRTGAIVRLNHECTL